MIKQGSVTQIRRQELPRANTQIIVTMCYYPRGIKKEWRDQFISMLAPSRELFTRWKTFEKESGHEEAFRLAHYEERFRLSPLALGHLKIFSEASRSEDIYFICQCEVGERCHREMLMLTARKKFGAVTDKIFHRYPVFEERIKASGSSV